MLVKYAIIGPQGVPLKQIQRIKEMLFDARFVVKTANAEISRIISFVYQVRMRECHLLAPALNLEMSVSVRAHAQLSNMHFTKTHLKVPNG